MSWLWIVLAGVGGLVVGIVVVLVLVNLAFRAAVARGLNW